MASQTIVGPELQYTQDNLRCYAYSGIVLVADAPATSLLSFTSGSGFIMANFQFNFGQETSEKFEYVINFNSVQVQEYLQEGQQNPHNLIPLIIPPFTTVQATAQNKSSSNERLMFCTLTGRVYDYLPVRN